MRYRTATVVLAGLLLTGCASTQVSGGSAGAGPGSSAPNGSASTTSGPGMGGTANPGPTGGATSGSTGSSGSTNLLTPAQIAAVAATCPSNQSFSTLNGPAARKLPADLTVDWVLRCTVSNKGGQRVLVAERSTGDVGPLVTALRTPSGLRAKVVCPMMRVYVPYFALVQPTGQVFVPSVPVNNCGAPQNAVVQALNSLRFAAVSSKPVK